MSVADKPFLAEKPDGKSPRNRKRVGVVKFGVVEAGAVPLKVRLGKATIQ